MIYFWVIENRVLFNALTPKVTQGLGHQFPGPSDHLGLTEAGSIGGQQHHGREESNLRVTQPIGVQCVGKVQQGVDKVRLQKKV